MINLQTDMAFMRYCLSKHYNFQLLLNGPLFSSDPTAETYTNDKEQPVLESILDLNEKEIYKKNKSWNMINNLKLKNT